MGPLIGKPTLEASPASLARNQVKVFLGAGREWRSPVALVFRDIREPASGPRYRLNRLTRRAVIM